MGEPVGVGRHTSRREEDIVVIRIDGTYDLESARKFHVLMEEALADRGRCYVLGDVAAMNGIQPEVRRLASEWHRRHTITAVILHGATFMTRVMATLMHGAVRLVSGRSFEVVFVQDEAEARTWIAAHRGRTV